MPHLQVAASAAAEVSGISDAVNISSSSEDTSRADIGESAGASQPGAEGEESAGAGGSGGGDATASGAATGDDSGGGAAAAGPPKAPFATVLISLLEGLVTSGGLASGSPRAWECAQVRHGYHTTLHRNTAQHNITQRNAKQRNATQHNATRHDTTQHNTTQHNTTQHSATPN
jgi:hypothetical protein